MHRISTAANAINAATRNITFAIHYISLVFLPVTQAELFMKMPEGLSFDLASVSESRCSVLACHERINTSKDDVVVIMGAGLISYVIVDNSRCPTDKVVQADQSYEWFTLSPAQKWENCHFLKKKVLKFRLFRNPVGLGWKLK